MVFVYNDDVVQRSVSRIVKVSTVDLNKPADSSRSSVCVIPAGL